ncbi:MAG: lipopolysaccharide kinase InaA family protein, partial [Phycisphaerae bacterium]
SGTGAVSLAGVEWEWMRRLAADGLPCPQAVALGEELHGGCEVRSLVLMEAVPGLSLESWAKEWADGDRTAARALIAPLAALIARFHALGYAHRDLYLSHIFYDPTPSPQRSLHLIDLQRVIRPRGRRLRWIIKDLASLNFSTPQAVIGRTDRLRWLTQYLGRRRLDQSARRLVYAIIGKTQRIARHDARRGRR